MRIAYIHVLPLEYYPPATTTLDLLSRVPGWEIRAWSSKNDRHSAEWDSASVAVERPRQSQRNASLPSRMAGYLNWHGRTAYRVARWKPDVVISVEPHSALASWTYYKIFSGRARLFIHHHEYYAPRDFEGSGMRLLRATRRLERSYLFDRAEWISQTNLHRLRLLEQWNPTVTEKGHVFPNYPPEKWIARATALPRNHSDSRTRFLYVGSASLSDTFIGEFAQWVAARPEKATLHVVGNNISPDVWSNLRALRAANISFDERGCTYEGVAEILHNFDVGLVLYRGNTQNFEYNVPNKAIEYLAGRLEVWYPKEMRGMAEFHASHPALELREMNFLDLPIDVPASTNVASDAEFPFTAESATRPLIESIGQVR
jgi:hypothetical protein